jgi:hypothetical protein
VRLRWAGGVAEPHLAVGRPRIGQSRPFSRNASDRYISRSLADAIGRVLIGAAAKEIFPAVWLALCDAARAVFPK